MSDEGSRELVCLEPGIGVGVGVVAVVRGSRCSKG